MCLGLNFDNHIQLGCRNDEIGCPHRFGKRTCVLIRASASNTLAPFPSSIARTELQNVWSRFIRLERSCVYESSVATILWNMESVILRSLAYPSRAEARTLHAFVNKLLQLIAIKVLQNCNQLQVPN